MASGKTTEELLEEVLAALTGGSGSRFGGSGTPTPGGPPVGPDYAKIAKDAEAFAKRLRENTKDSNSWSKALKGQQQHFRDVSEDLKELDERIKETDSIVDSAARATARRELENARASVANAAAMDNNKKIVANFGAAMVTASSVVFAGAGKLTKSLQGSGSGMELATEMMGIGIDVANQGAQAAGGAMSSAGKVMQTSTSPKIKALGTVADIAGGLLGGLGDAASKLAKFGVEVLSKEVEKTVKAFNSAASSGALFADGMTGLRNASNDAGLTVDQFSGVLSKHSTDIAGAGLGVSEGAKRVGGALKSGGDKMKSEMLNLGYGFEEQAGLVAETMKDMRGSTGGPLKASNQAVAQETMKYAENLRVISAISGEDAKAKKKLVDEQAAQLGFQQKLSKLSPEQQAATKRAMQNMSEIERKNFMDMVNFGTVINKEGAAAMALSSGLTDSVNESAQAFREGTLDDVKQRDINKKNASQIQSDMIENAAIGTAAAAGVGGLAGALGESMGKELQYRNANTAEAIAAAEKAAAEQKKTTDPLTKGVTGAEVAVQNLKLSLEKELTPAIGQFATVAKEMLSSVQKMMKEAGLGVGAPGEAGGDEKGVWSSIKNTVGGWNDKLKENKALSTGLEVGGGAAMLGGAVASSTGFGAIGGVPLATIGGVMSGLGMLAGALGYSEGGIATGDESGHLEKLHGTELIVPMSGGELKKDSKGYADLMSMMGSSNLGSAAIPASGPMAESLSRNIYKPDMQSAHDSDVSKYALESIKTNDANIKGVTESLKMVTPVTGMFGLVAKTMLDSATTSNSIADNLIQGVENKANTSVDFVRGTIQDASQLFDGKVSAMLDNLTAGLEDVGPKVMQAAMNPLGTAMDAISSFMSPKETKSDKEDMLSQYSAGNADLAGAISTLIAASEAQLAKQDEMLRAMQDTKDYTERLYNAMS